MRSRYSSRATLVVAVALLPSGCVSVDATLGAGGSGTIDVEYIAVPQATIDSETARFTSPHVTVRELVPRRGAFLRVACDDVTKLSTGAGFADVTVPRDRKRGEEPLRVVIRNPTSKETVDDQGHSGPKVAVTLPGRVPAADRRAEAVGRRVWWPFPLREWANRPRIVLTVRYAVG